MSINRIKLTSDIKMIMFWAKHNKGTIICGDILAKGNRANNIVCDLQTNKLSLIADKTTDMNKFLGLIKMQKRRRSF